MRSQRVERRDRVSRGGGGGQPDHVQRYVCQIQIPVAHWRNGDLQSKPANPNPPTPDPGFCNTNLNMVHVNVDLSLPANQTLNPELEDNEFIEVFSTPLADLYAECKKLEQQGYAIDARVGTLAEGMEIARRWKLYS